MNAEPEKYGKIKILSWYETTEDRRRQECTVIEIKARSRASDRRRPASWPPSYQEKHPSCAYVPCEGLAKSPTHQACHPWVLEIVLPSSNRSNLNWVVNDPCSKNPTEVELFAQNLKNHGTSDLLMSSATVPPAAANVFNPRKYRRHPHLRKTQDRPP